MLFDLSSAPMPVHVVRSLIDCTKHAWHTCGSGCVVCRLSHGLTCVLLCRCAASGQDARTVQRALIKLVADLKPASHANTSQYQLITKNVGRLSVFLGAR